MPSIPLPENPSLDHLKNQAKLVQQLVRDGDEGGVALVREFHPRHRNGDADVAAEISDLQLADAQLTVARLYGFGSWARLREHVESVNEHTRPDIADVPTGDAVDEFVALGCVTYGHHDAVARTNRANELLAGEPTLARGSVAAMATAGAHEPLASMIDRDAAIVDAPCGPNAWPPLLYCTYSRVESDGSELSTLETARLLLDRGADPNAGFLWRGLVPPFTALTGAFGHGEQDQSPHADRLVLARLLLDAGADPNDGQTLYNNGLAGTAHDDPGHLALLCEFGLGTEQSGPWYGRFGSRLTAPAELLYDELEVAALRGLPNRMEFLIGLGLDLERGVGRSAQTPLGLARDQGHDVIVDLLAAAGVRER